jgi:hypothetical protein
MPGGKILAGQVAGEQTITTRGRDMFTLHVNAQHQRAVTYGEQ